jgi:hypothetical protein
MKITATIKKGISCLAKNCFNTRKINPTLKIKNGTGER